MATPLLPSSSLPILSVGALARSRVSTLRWALACGLALLPLTAILHHALFYRETCMLNNFGPAYTADVVAKWLSRDPSLWLGMLLVFATFQLGNRVRGIRPLVAAFTLAFLPLALWIWDLPFTGRMICDALHDGRIHLLEGLPLKSRHFYLVGGVLYGSFLVKWAWAHLVPQRSSASHAPV